MAAYSRMNPSPRYRELLDLYVTMHAHGAPEQGDKAEDMFAGTSLKPHVEAVGHLIRGTGSHTLLDYGCGKARLYGAPAKAFGGAPGTTLQEHWGLDAVTLYDPAYPTHNDLPAGSFDGVICTDVLEHVPQEDVPWVLDEIFGYAKKFVYLNVACYPAKKILPNGENAHCTIQPQDWWLARITEITAGRPPLQTTLVFTDQVHAPSAKSKGLFGKLFG